MELHSAGEQHPEQPARHAVITQKMESIIGDRCVRIPSRVATDAEVLVAHSRAYCEEVKSAEKHRSRSYHARLERTWQYDVFVNVATPRAALLSLGCSVEAAGRVARGDLAHALACVRPPGHHACKARAMGFCFFNNAAVVAKMAVNGEGPFAAAAKKMDRVLIVDWDVHHGNGTQALTYDDPRILYFSVHRGLESRKRCGSAKFYPGTGTPSEVGTGKGRGFNANVAWSEPGMGDAEYYHCWDRLVAPLAQAFKPQLIVVSAGFDAARGDPLGECDVTPRAYHRLTRDLARVAPCVVLLEGGYNLDIIGEAFAACASALLGDAVPPEACELGDTDDASFPQLDTLADALCDPNAAADVHAAVKALAPFWPALVRRHRALSERGSDRFVLDDETTAEEDLVCQMTGIALDDASSGVAPGGASGAGP